jgi:hypothetical protein
VSGLSSRPDCSGPAIVQLTRHLHYIANNRPNFALVALLDASYNPRMNVREAKDFLVNQAAQQAAIDGVPLSDLEKRMMYFSESDPTCEDPLALNAEFEAQYGTNEYEPKISRLLHRAYKRAKKESLHVAKQWGQAIGQLRQGDHYVLVLWDYRETSPKKPPFDDLRLLGTALLIVCAVLLVSFNSDRIAPYLPQFLRGPVGWRVLVYGLIAMILGVRYLRQGRKISKP